MRSALAGLLLVLSIAPSAQHSSVLVNVRRLK